MSQSITMTRETETHVLSWIRLSTMAEGIVGVIGGFLAVIALYGVYPPEIMSLAGIVLGISLMLESWAVSHRLLRVLEATSKYGMDLSGLNTGTTVEFLAGVSGIILSVLAIFGVTPQILMSVTVVLFGGAIILGGGLSSTLNAYLLRRADESEEFKQLAGRAMATTSEMQLLLGMGALTLGILALCNINPMILTLVAFIGIGLSDLLRSVTLGSKIARMNEHWMQNILRPRPQ